MTCAPKLFRCASKTLKMRFKNDTHFKNFKNDAHMGVRTSKTLKMMRTWGYALQNFKNDAHMGVRTSKTLKMMRTWGYWAIYSPPFSMTVKNMDSKKNF